MKRRDFIKKSALTASVPFWLQSCHLTRSKSDFPIHVHSDQATGHLIMKGINWPKGKALSTGTVIVGGGIAGLTAAYQLKNQDYLLLEVSDHIGGTSASKRFEGISFTQGAHYDHPYPTYYGEDVLQMLEQLKVIQYEPWYNNWNFIDKEHLIPQARRQTCYDQGKRRTDVIEDPFLKQQFYQALAPFEGKMPLPTRLISPDLQRLNELTFKDFLTERMELTTDFQRQINYYLMDDYGGTCEQVSALAGIHYFKCRPYHTEPVGVFSPPNGNDYFVQKIRNNLASNKIKNKHLIYRIEKNGASFLVHALDIVNQKSLIIHCDQVIYAGQKHALKYVYPDDHSLFNDINYAPWMVINFITNSEPGIYGFWQNEYLGANNQFLGFVDSSVQSPGTASGKRVFTAYYCLKPEDRNYLTTIDSNKERIATETLEKIEEMLEKKVQVTSAHIKVMGHAMPIPQPGYLFKNLETTSGIQYAGVDCGRLPLLFEALDSGIMAAKTL